MLCDHQFVQIIESSSQSRVPDAAISPTMLCGCSCLISIQNLNFNRRSPELYFVTLPPKGDVVSNPSLDFLYGRLDTLYLLSVYRYEPPPSIDFNMSTIDLHMTSPWRHKVSTPSEIWIYWKYTWKSATSIFAFKSLKRDFLRNFGWICKEMMILIYIGSLKNISCQIFKKWQNKSYVISPTSLYHSLLWPHTQTIRPHVTSYTSKDA